MKGCCFVTFYTRKAALDAQNALHNIKALPGVHHCVQMKPADSENKSEDRKLFVGMLSKKLTEQDLRLMFSPFGTIEECRILLNPDGISKGCAFITYSKRASAQTAIRHMHQSITMEGCSAPIVVKIADSPKDKEWKKTQLQLAQQLNQLATQWKSFTGLAALAPILQSLSNCGSNAVGLGNTNGGNQSVGGLTPNAVQQALNIAAAAQTLLNNSPGALPNITSNAVQQSNHISSNITSSPVPYPSGAVANGFGSPCVSSANSLEHMSQLTLNSHCGVSRGMELGHLASNSSGTSLRPTANMLVNMAALTQPSSLYNHSMLSHLGNSVAGSQKEGPEGANLFIYHLPSHFTDHDLLQAFIPFGNVISAKVFIDKQTNLSKCFGFVSYDNPLSAQQAIQAMHGFQIGVKRLKVQLKRSKNEIKATY